MTLPMMPKEQVEGLIASIANYGKETDRLAQELLLNAVHGDIPVFETRAEIIAKIGHQASLIETKILEQSRNGAVAFHIKNVVCDTIERRAQVVLAAMSDNAQEQFRSGLREAFGLDVKKTLTDDDIEAKMWRDRVNKEIENKGNSR